MGVRGSWETTMVVGACVWEKGCRKRGGSTPSVYVFPNVNHCREQCARAGVCVWEGITVGDRG